MTTPYATVCAHVREIAQQCGRDHDEITVIAVSKTVPTPDILTVYDQGCRDFGERRLQEFLPKQQETPSDIRWHLIGSLQTKKVKHVVGKFYLIHSVDTLKLAQNISVYSSKADATTKILLQVNVSGEESKHGLSVDEWRHSFDDLLELPNIEILGLMTMAPYTDNEIVIRNCFSGLREFKDELRRRSGNLIGNHLSMGMSGDYALAIKEGSTILRIGSAIFN